MNAIGLNRYGGLEVLQVVELPDPHPKPDACESPRSCDQPRRSEVRDGSLSPWFADAPPPFVPGIRDNGTILVLSPQDGGSLDRCIRTVFVNVRQRITDHTAITRIGQQVAKRAVAPARGRNLSCGRGRRSPPASG